MILTKENIIPHPDKQSSDITRRCPHKSAIHKPGAALNAALWLYAMEVV